MVLLITSSRISPSCGEAIEPESGSATASIFRPGFDGSLIRRDEGLEPRARSCQSTSVYAPKTIATPVPPPKTPNARNVAHGSTTNSPRPNSAARLPSRGSGKRRRPTLNRRGGGRGRSGLCAPLGGADDAVTQPEGGRCEKQPTEESTMPIAARPRPASVNPAATMYDGLPASTRPPPWVAPRRDAAPLPRDGSHTRDRKAEPVSREH